MRAQRVPSRAPYKIGGWYDSYNNFDDRRYDNEGVPLASPASNGIAADHHGNYAFYGVVDQTIWRSKDDSNRNINVFIRPMFTPLQDRNLISFSVNAGLTMQEPFIGRSDDTFGLGMGVARVSNSASRYYRDLNFYNPTAPTPVPARRPLSRRLISFRPRNGGRFSPISSISSIPPAGSATRTIQRRRSRTNW